MTAPLTDDEITAYMDGGDASDVRVLATVQSVPALRAEVAQLQKMLDASAARERAVRALLTAHGCDCGHDADGHNGDCELIIDGKTCKERMP